MRLDPETQDYLDTLAARGPAQPPATLSEAFTSSWAAAGLSTPGGVAAPRAQALDELRGAWRSATGADLDEEARRLNIPVDQASDDQKAAAYALLAQGLPETAQKQIAPHLDIDARAATIAAQTERAAAETAERAWGVGPNAALWLAGMARTMVDPATLVATGAVAALTPETAGLAPFLAREAFVNAATTAATLPGVNVARAQLGLEPAPFLESLGESAVGGAALGGLLRGAGVAARRLLGRPDAPAGVRAATTSLDPEDFDLAARHFDNRDIEAMQARSPNPVDVAAHDRGVAVETASIERGPSILPEANDAAAGNFPDIPESSSTASATPVAPEPPAVAPEPPPVVASTGRFKTEKGSTYEIHEDGTTTRNKAARNDAGHEGDFGQKARTARTIYVDTIEQATNLSGAGITDTTKKGFHVVIRNGKATLISWNGQHNRWGATPDSLNISFSETPAIGKYPVELWRPGKIQGLGDETVYSGQHAGNKIVELSVGSVVPEPPPVAPPRPLADYPLPALVDAPAPAPVAAPETPAIVVRPKRKTVREFLTLFEMLARSGGLAPNSELAVIFDGNPFVPGFGRLVRANGRTLDDALTLAKEAGYLYDPNDAPGAGPLTLTTNDLLDLLQRESHGEKIHSLADQSAIAERDAQRAAKDFVKYSRQAEKKLVAATKSSEIDYDPSWPPDQEIFNRARLILTLDTSNAVTPVDAWRAAVEEYRAEAQARAEQWRDIQKARQDDTGLIDGWDEDLADDDPGAASETGGDRAQSGQDASGEISGAGEDRRRAGAAGASSSKTGEPDALLTEPGAEGKPQTLVPGVAPVTDRQRAELAATKPLRGGDAPPPAGGLFDSDARAQTDFFDAASLPAAPPGLSALRDAAEKAIAEAGDAPFYFSDEAGGEPRSVKPSDLLREVDEDAAAAREFLSCLGGFDPGDAP